MTVNLAADANYNGASISFDYQIKKADQTITFGSLPIRTYGDAPFQLAATSSSGLPVNFSTSYGSITISGKVVTINNAAGSIIIYANQLGNLNYNPAQPVNQQLTIQKANQTITFNPLPTKNCGDDSFPLTATSSSGLPVTTFQSTNGYVASVPSNVNTLYINGNGTCLIAAISEGDNNYNPASTSQNFTVLFPASITSSGVLCVDGSQILTANTGISSALVSNTTWIWNTSNYTQSITTDQAGTYTVLIQVDIANGSGGHCSTNLSYIIPPASIQCAGGRIASNDEPIIDSNEPTVTEVSVYPNPASKEFTLALPEKAKEDVPVYLFDMMGKTLISSTIPQGKWKVSVSLEKIIGGMYLVKVGYGDKAVVKKVMVVE